MKDSIRKWLTEQIGDDPELHNEVYGEYVADMKARIAKLPELLASKDTAALGEEGHTMKGIALQIGDEEAVAPCTALQDAGRARNLEGCVEPVRLLRELTFS